MTSIMTNEELYLNRWSESYILSKEIRKENNLQSAVVTK